MSAVEVALDAIAVTRLTMVIVSDEITHDVRVSSQARLVRDGHPKLAYLLGCPWCAGWWVALACAGIRARYPRLWRAARWPLVTSFAAGFIGERL